MYCSECGERLGEGMAFCPRCGAPVAKVELAERRAAAADGSGPSERHGAAAGKPLRSPAPPMEPPRRARRAGITLLLCLVMLVLVMVGEVVGYLLAMGMDLDADVVSTAGGALCGVAGVVLLGGGTLLKPSREALLRALRSGWWVIATSLVLFAVDLVGSIMDGSFAVSEHVVMSVLGVGLLCLFVGIVEECMFRGLVLGGLLDVFGSTRRGIVVAAVVSSLLFGAAHIDWAALDASDLLSVGQAVLKVAQTGMLGFFLAVLTLCDKSLVGPMMLHGLSDFLLLLSYVGIQGHSSEVNYVSLGEEEAWATMGIYVVVIALYVPLLVRAIRMLREVEAPDRGAFHRG